MLMLSGFVFSLCKGFSNRNEQFVIYHICVKAILIKYDSYTGAFSLRRLQAYQRISSEAADALREITEI